MNCPNCGAAMRERDRSGVKVDFCPECKGVWLDRGELDKIVAIEVGDDDDDDGLPARHAENARLARRDDDDDDDRYGRRGEYRKKSKKSSFFEGLTEMFGGE